MLSFYKQYKLEDFLNMDINTFKFLAKGMSQQEAQDHLLLMDAVSYPHLDSKNRTKSHKKWYKIAYPENFEQKVVKTSDLRLI